MFKSKRALSPLIASVLLIVVVVGIGAVVTSMLRGMVQENKQTIESKSDQISCSSDVMVEVIRIDGISQICKGAGYIDVVLENAGGEIDDFQLVVVGTTGIYTNDSIMGGKVFARGQAMELNGTFDTSVVASGNVIQAKFVPKLKKKSGGGFNYCFDVAIVATTMDDC
ncbi:MAG: hypothetical protein V1729_03350 [Candidatus Woesearchaeota archaeon]